MDLANDSLQSLSKIESLKSLRLSGCKFDSADWEELRALRPDLEIDYHD